MIGKRKGINHNGLSMSAILIMSVRDKYHAVMYVPASMFNLIFKIKNNKKSSDDRWMVYLY